jgi:hypothetical protein
MPVSEDTTHFIATSLAGPLQRLETKRRGALAILKRTRRRLKVGACGAVMLAILVAGPLGLLIGSLAAFIAYPILSGRTRERLFGGPLRDEFKQDTIRPLVAHLVPAAVYRPDGHIVRAVFEESGLYQVKPSEFRGGDLTEGRLGRASLSFSELNVEHVDPPAGRYGRRTAFKGLFFVADFRREFAGFTIVRPRRTRALGTSASRPSRGEDMNTGGGSAGLPGTHWSPSASRYGRLQQVELADPVFAERFDVYTTDVVEARQLLSPAMVQRLLVESGTFCVSFANAKVYIARHHVTDLFQIDPARPLTSAAIEGYAADLQFALGIVEDVNLDTRISSEAPAR